MSFSASNITLRGGVWYFRKRVPAELISAYGRKMVSTSLETRDKGEAKVRAQLLRDQTERLFAGMGRSSAKVADGYSGTLIFLTDQDVENLCLRYRSYALLEDERYRSTGIIDAMREQDLDIYEQYLPSLRSAYAGGQLEHVYENLEMFLRSINVRVPKGTLPYESLARRFQLAQIDVLEAILKRRHGHSVPIPLAPCDNVSLDDVFKAWKKRKTARPIATVKAFERAFNELRARTSASSSATQLTDDDAVKFRDQLIDEDLMSKRTIAKLIGFLRAAFECSRRDKRLKANVFADIDVEIDEQETEDKERLPFTIDEMNKLFSSALYKPDFKARASLGAAARWLPVLGPFAAARLEEFCQMKYEDVIHDKDNGWYFRIHGKLKNAASKRNVPVHPRLIELGFIDYVKSIESGPLFPALKTGAANKFSATYSTWFGRVLDGLGITDDTKVYHSFRHNFAEECKVKGEVVQTETREAILGHRKKAGIKERYGKALHPLEPMVAAMRHVQYEGLDLSHVLAANLGKEHFAPRKVAHMVKRKTA
ncbi:MAG: site-specific integrase [Betaproteobacteria bacterium]